MEKISFFEINIEVLASCSSTRAFNKLKSKKLGKVFKVEN